MSKTRLAAIFVWLLTSCAPARNSLTGSLSEIFSLEFDAVEVLKLGCTLRVDYIRSEVFGEVSPCLLLVDNRRLALRDGATVDGDSFREAVQVLRVAPTGGELPEVESGSMSFDRFTFESGASVEGSFTVAFVDGHDLHGRFEQILVEPDPSLECEPR